MKTRICPQCGKIIPSDAITCKNCGRLQFSSGKDIGEEAEGFGLSAEAPDDDLGGSPVQQGGYAGPSGKGFQRRLDRPLEGFEKKPVLGNDQYDDDYDYDYDDDDEAAADNEEVSRQINRERGFIYEDELDEEQLEDFDPDEADANRRKLLIIIVTTMTVLVVGFVVLLIAMQSRNKTIEKRADIATKQTEPNIVTFPIESLADTTLDSSNTDNMLDSKDDSSKAAVTTIPTTTTKRPVTTAIPTTTTRPPTTTTRTPTTTTTPRPTTTTTTTTTTTASSSKPDTSKPDTSSLPGPAPSDSSSQNDSSAPDSSSVPEPPADSSAPDNSSATDDSVDTPPDESESEIVYTPEDAEKFMKDFAAENGFSEDFKRAEDYEEEDDEIIYAYYNEDGTVESMYRVDRVNGDVSFYVPDEEIEVVDE